MSDLQGKKILLIATAFLAMKKLCKHQWKDLEPKLHIMTKDV